MKSILKVTLLAALLALTSCAHHRKGCCGGCDHKDKKEQCPMKSEHHGDKPAEEAPKK